MPHLPGMTRNGRFESQKRNGERGGIRTRGHRIKSPMLYQLSYPSTNRKGRAGMGGVRRVMRVLYADFGMDRKIFPENFLSERLQPRRAVRMPRGGGRD